MRRIFYTAILAEEKIFSELGPWIDKEEDWKRYFQKRTSKILRSVKANSQTWPYPLDIDKYFRHLILKSFFKLLNERYPSEFSYFCYLLVDRYGWWPPHAAVILGVSINKVEQNLRLERLHVMRIPTKIDKSCFLFRSKVIPWEFSYLYRGDAEFIEHYKKCSLCQKDYEHYQAAKNLAKEKKPLIPTSESVALKKPLDLRQIGFVMSFILVGSAVMVIVFPQVKQMLALKSIKSIRYYEDAQNQIFSSIDDVAEQLTVIQTKSQFPQSLASIDILKEYEKNSPKKEEWVDNQLKTRVTRIFAKSKDIILAKKELQALFMDLKLEPAAKHGEIVEARPNGLSSDVYVSKQNFEGFKQKLNQINSIRDVDVKQYKLWDGNRARVVLWINKEF